MTERFTLYLRYILAILMAAALFITGAGLSPATAADPTSGKIDAAETVTTRVAGKTVISGTDSGVVGLTLPGTLTSQSQVSLAEVPEEYLEVTQTIPLASTRLPHGAVSSYETGNGTQTLIRVDSAEAAKEYRFPLSLPVGATAELIGGGSVLIKDAGGETLGGYKTPWAVDANDAPVLTRFTLEGNILVQTVDFTPKTAFPVVADPNWWQFPTAIAVGAAVSAAVASIPGGGVVSSPAGGCAAGAMSAMFDGADFWVAFGACVAAAVGGGWHKTIFNIATKILRKFGFGR